MLTICVLDKVLLKVFLLFIMNAMEENSKQQDLVYRTQKFARDVRNFIKQIPKWYGMIDDTKQLIRSSGSVAANYIEAQEALSTNDFLYRNRLCRKEARESIVWLGLLDCSLPEKFEAQREILLIEAKELVLIFSAIIKKGERKIQKDN